MASDALRMKKKRVLEKAGFVYRYGHWILPRHEVMFAGMVLSASNDAREVLRGEGWSEGDISAALPEREPVSSEGRTEWEKRQRLNED